MYVSNDTLFYTVIVILSIIVSLKYSVTLIISEQH